MRIGLFFGSFNPIHTGHLIVAQHMLNHGPFDLIRFVVSPQNPFKESMNLMDENLRFQMVQIAIADNPGFEASDVEFSLPKPSYTIQTILHFAAAEPMHTFSIILGSDNLEKLQHWKDIHQIAANCDFHVYRRRGSEFTHPAIEAKFVFYEAPFLDLSATLVREYLQQGKSLKYIVPDVVIPLLKRD